MIRFDALFRRRPGISREEFLRYWLEQHGPLVVSLQPAFQVDRYVQSHTVDDPIADALREPRPGMGEPFDGYATVWWRTRGALEERLGSPEAEKATAVLMQDEAHFIDWEQSQTWFSLELPHVNPVGERAIVANPESPLLKISFVVGCKDGMSIEQAQAHWRTTHAYILRRYAEALGVRRYLQVHRLEDPLNEQFRASRGAARPSFFGLAEAWVDRAHMNSITPESAGARGAEELLKDEPNFWELTRSAAWVAQEHVLINR